MDRRSLGRILVGLVYTYVGLVVFLTGNGLEIYGDYDIINL